MNVSYLDPVVATFVAIPTLLAAAFAWGVLVAWRRSDAPHPARAALIALGATAAWMAATWALAESGVLRDWERTPPPLFLLVAAIVLLTGAIACTRVGLRLARGLPLWGLVGVQAFRFPLELAMHEMSERGIMPEQMTYTSRNFDIVTGMTAVVVASLVFAGRAGRGLVVVWNVLGLALVLNVVVVAILATPRFRYFGNESLNVWITYTPFVWLPSVMVLAALAGHLVVFRALEPPGRG